MQGVRLCTTGSHRRNDISAYHDRPQWGRVRSRQNIGHYKNRIKTH
jgi:hypothetical protein